MPEAAPIEVIEGLAFAHLPPAITLPSVAVLPWHTDEAPVIGVVGWTVTASVEVQPAGVW
jgi:hypothetical protein